ncbi:MAG: radical SAM family heme chaperone HemW [Gaiellaceae bacterium]
MSGARHLYVHLPFCAHRCGYCDFVTLVDRVDQHDAYATALVAELALERDVLAQQLETVFVGGGTPTFTEPHALARVLESLPPANEVTVEANPETVTPELAALLRSHGVNRVSLGAQTFRAHLLAALERRADADTIRRAVGVLRTAGFDNVSLDLIYGIPGQSVADLDADLDDALALTPEHISAYELEAKPGTRFTYSHGEELQRQADAMETYFEHVVDRLTGAGYRWYETANFCRRSGDRDLRSRHNLGYWHGRDYLGIGIGAVSTLGERRWRNAPRLASYIAALAAGEAPPREHEPLSHDVKRRERVMLGLRLDEPLELSGVRAALDVAALARMRTLGLAELVHDAGAGDAVRLTPRGRLLGGGVTAELLT